MQGSGHPKAHGSSSPIVSWPRSVAFLLTLAAWLGFGLMFGWHWWVLFLCAARSPAERLACVIHFVFHIIALLFTAIGGSYCRSSEEGYVQCITAEGANISMSRDCLWALQPERYRVVYVLHFIGGGWLLSAWILDLLSIPIWTLYPPPSTRGMPSFYHSHAPLFPHYAIVITCATFFVTLTWTIFFDWDDFNLGFLGGILVAVILGVGGLSRPILKKLL